MITIATYTIHCDEEGCTSADTFPLAQSAIPGLYEIRAPDEVYAHFGGEALEDGRHRCSVCRAKLKPPSPEPQEICARLDRIVSSPSAATTVLAVVERARDYRQMEHDRTPRLWRGKDLQDRAIALDESIEEHDITIAQRKW